MITRDPAFVNPTLPQLAPRWDPQQIVIADASTLVGKQIVPGDGERWYISFVAESGGVFVSPFAYRQSLNPLGVPVPTGTPILEYSYPDSGNLCQQAWYVVGAALAARLYITINAWRVR